MTLKPIQKRFTSLTRLALSVPSILALTAVHAALAQPVFQDGVDLGLTSIYTDSTSQDQKVGVLKKAGYRVTVPFNVRELSLDPSGLGDGSFQSADLDFSTASPSIPGTNTRIAFTGPITTTEGVSKTSKLFAVVAGKPSSDICPVEIQETQIVFLDNKDQAGQKAQDLYDAGYLVYVGPNDTVVKNSVAKIKCQPDVQGVIVNGKTQKVTVDFTNIATLLPPRLQQPAKKAPFVYSPKRGAIYLVNARKAYKPSPTASARCYWMENYTGRFTWVNAPQGNISKERCYALDSCDGGLGQSGGGCYKWATSPNADRIPWKR